MNDSKDLRLGDLVVLNSGGPTMTIAGFPQGGTAECFWFHPSIPWVTDRGTETAYSQELQRAVFPIVTLTKKAV